MVYEIEIHLAEDEGLFMLHGDYHGFYYRNMQGVSY